MAEDADNNFEPANLATRFEECDGAPPASRELQPPDALEVSDVSDPRLAMAELEAKASLVRSEQLESQIEALMKRCQEKEADAEAAAQRCREVEVENEACSGDLEKARADAEAAQKSLRDLEL